MNQIISLKESLFPLKESSMSAIADATCEVFDDIKSYLHLERDIEEQLRSFLESVKDSTSKKLFLVCGNVGDGKSHLLASINIKHPELLADVKLHNDATESSEPDASFIDELNNLFEPFSDEYVDSGDSKVIVAINLGTLNNFLTADAEGRFSKLQQYVRDKKILDVGDIVECKFEENSPFQFVNFCDHNLFHLTKNGPESTLIENAIEKVVSQEGPFFKSYLGQKEKNLSYCPICYNFELLQSPTIRKKISSLLIECIVKGEIIISIRALYNFIYELIVPIELEPLGSSEILQRIKSYKEEDFLRNIIPNYIFCHPELSSIFEQIQKHDPAVRRGEILDEAIIELMISESPQNIVKQYIPPETIGESLYRAFVHGAPSEEYINCFIRTAFFWPKTEDVLIQSPTYELYMSFMYDWYSGNTKSLKYLYKLVQNAVTSWRGKARPGKINVHMGRQQLDYQMSESIKMSPDPPEALMSKEEYIQEFNAFIPVRFRVDGEVLTLAVTYNLFLLMSKIDQGYRPTSLDQSNFIVFDEFVEKVSKSGEGQKQVFFTESTNKREFVLELDGFGDFYFGEVIR